MPTFDVFSFDDRLAMLLLTLDPGVEPRAWLTESGDPIPLGRNDQTTLGSGDRARAGPFSVAQDAESTRISVQVGDRLIRLTRA